MELRSFWVPARKDLIQLVEETSRINLLKELGEDPDAWIDELGIINRIITGEMLNSVTFENPPLFDEPGFVRINDGVYANSGGNTRWRGVWVKSARIGRKDWWTHFHFGCNANLLLDIKGDDFSPYLPENFELKGEAVQLKDHLKRRDVYKFEVNGELVFAKGSKRMFFRAPSVPSYRKTRATTGSFLSPHSELETFTLLQDQGINIPRILGYYLSLYEEYLFMEGIPGDHLNQEIIEQNRDVIIQQDAEILAGLLLIGKKKPGFEDYDDKIFDGIKLYLIDVDECEDLYVEFRERVKDMGSVLFAPESNQIELFREIQKALFIKHLRRNLHYYRETLTPNDVARKTYVKAFFSKIGWDMPKGDVLQEIIVPLG